MPSKLTLLGTALLAWGGVVAIAALAIGESRFVEPMVAVAILAATGGLVVSIIGAARYEPY